MVLNGNSGIGRLIAVRYYVYISDAKVDMILPQIAESFQKKITRNVGIDWKIISAKQTTELTPIEHRTHRLRAVEEYLRENEPVGSSEEPQSWFADELPMEWGPLSSFTGQDPENETLVWFAGRKNISEPDEVTVGLGGSLHHVLGYDPADYPGRSSRSSALFGIRGVLRTLGIRSGADGDYVDEEELTDRERLQRDGVLLRAATELSGRANDDSQRVEFLAKRLYTGHPPPGKSSPAVVIGSPLYVSLVD